METADKTIALEQLFRRVYPYACDYLKTGVTVSIKLPWEQVRHDLKKHRIIKVRRGQKISKVNGYSLNNNFHAHAARFIIQRRPQWAGMFDEREIGGSKRKGPVFVKAGIVLTA